jgi:hypothetical protein
VEGSRPPRCDSPPRDQWTIFDSSTADSGSISSIRCGEPGFPEALEGTAQLSEPLVDALETQLQCKTAEGGQCQIAPGSPLRELRGKAVTVVARRDRSVRQVDRDERGDLATDRYRQRAISEEIHIPVHGARREKKPAPP